MTDPEKDAGLLEVLIERFQQQRLPRALDLKEKVDRGERLNEWDTAYLEEIIADAEEVKLLVDKHPEYQDLYARAAHLYKEITEKALANEKGTSAP